jgi:tungstate transport system ATP-binding protein
MSIIETLNLGKKYEHQYILKNINLKINTGDVLALIGPTGAGKTTLLRLLSLLEKPSEGSIMIFGTDIINSRKHLLKVRRQISYVQQKPVVFDMSVFHNIACGLKWRGEERKAIKQRVGNTLDLVDLTNYENRNARSLSGGEVQRVAIARALALKPDVLLLDEPTANLDPNSITKIEEILSHIITEQKLTVVIATHDLSQGQYLANKIGVLMNGKLLQTGSPDEIFSSPINREVAEFVGIKNILEGEVTGKDDDLIDIKINDTTVQVISDYAIGEKVYILIRPEDIILTLSQDKTSARNTFLGKIVKAIPIGPLIHIKAFCGFPILVVVTKRSADELRFIAGQDIYVSFKATAIHTIKR